MEQQGLVHYVLQISVPTTKTKDRIRSAGYIAIVTQSVPPIVVVLYASITSAYRTGATTTRSADHAIVIRIVPRIVVYASITSACKVLLLVARPRYANLVARLIGPALVFAIDV